MTVYRCVTMPAALISVAVALAGCSKSSDSPVVAPAPSGGVSSSPAAAACATYATGNPVTITIASFAFSPSAVTAKVCQRVHVVNTDGVLHTWSGKGAPFGSPSLAKNQTYDYQFPTAGTFNVVCHFHASMTGTITITP